MEVLDIVCNCLMDIFGCGLLVLCFLECIKYFGLLVEGILVLYGVWVLGIFFWFDLVKVVWDIGCIVCWLDYNDIWLVVEWGYFLDNFGGIFVVVDYFLQKCLVNGEVLLSMCQVLEVMIMVYEIQGVIVLENLFNCVGFDYVLLVKVVFIVVCVKLMGVDCE